MSNTNEQLAAAIVRANERLDWIEERDRKLPDDNYATIETTVGVVRALRGAGVNTTQPEDLLPAWEAFNGSLAALIESANGEYVEQRRFTAFEAGWRAGGMGSVDATLRDTLVQQATRRIKQLTEERDDCRDELSAVRGELRAKLAASEQRAAALVQERDAAVAVIVEVKWECDWCDDDFGAPVVPMIRDIVTAALAAAAPSAGAEGA